MQMKLLAVCLVLMLFFCTNPLGEKGSSGGSTIKITGAIAKGLAKTNGVADNADAIVALPCTNGEFVYMDEMYNATVNTDGSFSISLPKVLKYHQINSQDIPVEWVLLLINSAVASRFERVLGFVALKDLDQSLIKIPVNKAKGDVDLGKLEQHGNEAQSGAKAEDDTAKFNLSISQLKEMARTGKTLKLAQNAYANFHGDDGEKLKSFTYGCFGIYAGYQFGMFSLADVQGKELLPGTYVDLSKIYYNVNFVTFNRTLYDYAQIANRTISFDLYPPTAIRCMVGGNPKDPSAKITGITAMVISTDSTKNPLDPTSGDPNKGIASSRINYPIPDDRADVSGMQRFWFGPFLGEMPNGLWQFKKNTGEVTAEFDLGLGRPFDSTGKPIIYVPSVFVSVNSSDNTVASVTLKWYSWDAVSNKYVAATDAELVKNAVSFAEVHLMSDLKESIGEKIWFGFSNQGVKAPREIDLTMIATPTNKFTYASPLMIDIDYRTGGQAFELTIGK